MKIAVIAFVAAMSLGTTASAEEVGVVSKVAITAGAAGACAYVGAKAGIAAAGVITIVAGAFTGGAGFFAAPAIAAASIKTGIVGGAAICGLPTAALFISNAIDQEETKEK